MRWFNTAGPCNPSDHYMLRATARLPEATRLIDRKDYFVLYAPRQTGKTTAMLALARELTVTGRYVAALLTMEAGASFADDPGAAELAILDAWRTDALKQLPADLAPPPWSETMASNRLGSALREWAAAASRPLVVFLDEIDALRGEALVSLLRYLRASFPMRPTDFPQSVALIRSRTGGDYRAAARSFFNIIAESLTLTNFTLDDVTTLYAQHTADTGQVFTPEALARAFELTQGQPWLVNALARQATEGVAPDPATPITPAIIDQAKEWLIEHGETNLDNLAEWLREERVRRVILPILAGQELIDAPLDDHRFALDLGLVRRDPERGLVIANPIYRQILLAAQFGSGSPSPV